VEEIFKRLAETVALTVEAGAALIIAYGAIEALWGTASTLLDGGPKTGRRRLFGCDSASGFCSGSSSSWQRISFAPP